MIGRLLRDDPMLRIQPVVLAMVALMAGILGPMVMEPLAKLADVTARTGNSRDVASELGPMVVLVLAVQALTLSALVSGTWAHRRDGVAVFGRALPMELVLPIAPRSSWSARLIAHLLTIALSGLTLVAVLRIVGIEAAGVLPWKVAGAGLALVLLVFGRAPERATLTRAADGWVLAAFGLVVFGALGNDVSALLNAGASGEGASDAGASIRFHHAVECVLGAALLHAGLAARRLPASWPLARPTATPTATPVEQSAAGARASSSATGATAATGAFRRQWAVIAATLGWTPMIASGLATVLYVPLGSATSEPWVLVVFTVWMVVGTARATLTRTRFLSSLPVSHRRLLAVALMPVLLGLALGAGIARGWELHRHGERPVVTLDDEIERRPAELVTGARSSFDVWMDVVVPRHHWRVAANGVVPLTVAPDGEEARPRAVHPLGLTGLTIYNPYDAPHGTSRAYTAWQFSRAIEAEFGVHLDPASLADQYLQTRKDGQVAFRSEQKARNLARNEEADATWYGAMGTLVSDHPELTPRFDGRRPALSVLAGVLLSVCAGWLVLRVRIGGPGRKVLAVVLPVLLMCSFSANSWMELQFGPGHPQALFAIAGESVLGWLPENALWVWLFTALVVAAGFELLARTMQRAEVIVTPSTSSA